MGVDIALYGIGEIDDKRLKGIAHDIEGELSGRQHIYWNGDGCGPLIRSSQKVWGGKSTNPEVIEFRILSEYYAPPDYRGSDWRDIGAAIGAFCVYAPELKVYYEDGKTSKYKGRQRASVAYICDIWDHFLWPDGNRPVYEFYPNVIEWNAQLAAEPKLCTRCDTSKPQSEFGKASARPDGLTAYCKLCTRSLNARNSKKNEAREVVEQEIVARGGCMDCGSTVRAVMEFDHVRGVKVANISKMVATAASAQDVRDELNKCDLLCANCHRVRTARRAGWRTLSLPEQREAGNP